MLRRTIELQPRERGFHLVTGEIVAALPELVEYRVGLLHLMIRHTSASLTINENASRDVLTDFRMWFDRAIPEDLPWTHVIEGADDMPAHIKAALTGSELTLPVTKGGLDLGTWQGIYLCEHRDHGGPRKVTATVWGSEPEP